MNNDVPKCSEGIFSQIERYKEIGSIDHSRLNPCYSCNDLHYPENMAFIIKEKGYICTKCSLDKTITELKKDAKREIVVIGGGDNTAMQMQIFEKSGIIIVDPALWHQKRHDITDFKKK